MSKQDRQGVRTAKDIEQKYNLGLLHANKQSTGKQSEQISQLAQTLAQFMATTNGKFEDLDRNTATWFYSGVPTLETLPASEWKSDETKDKHIGDQYFNEDDSSLYLFKRTETTDETTKETTVVYEWVKCFSDHYTKEEVDKLLESYVKVLDYTVSFYDENKEILAYYVVKEEQTINPPIDTTWVDSDGNVIEFPYTPTSDIDLYVSV